MTYSYYSDIFRGLPMPYAFVDMNALDENMAAVAQRAGGKPVRIASKSVRCVEVLRYLLQYPQFNGIMAYHPQEAAFLAQRGFDNILLGYPCIHPADIRAVLNEVAAGKQIIFMADSLEQITAIDREAATMGVQAAYCLDIDMSTDFPGLHFGVYRSPLHTLAQVQELFRSVQSLHHVRLAGIMGYEAQIAGVGDKVPGQGLKNALVRLLKKKSIQDLARRRGEIARWLQARTEGTLLVNAGGTGSLESSKEEPWVTEVTVGSAFYSSGLFDNYEQFHHRPAAAFAVEITRMPAVGMYTCLGGGYIASGEAGTAKQPKPYLPEGFTLIGQEGCGEVQTPIRYDGVEQLYPGAPVFFRHAKAGELCERFNHVYLVKDGRIQAEVPTYRGQGQCFI